MSVYRTVVEHVVTGVEIVGAGTMTVGGAVVLAHHAPAIARRRLAEAGYRDLRSELGRVLLVGLEILIVADIVNTIIVQSTLRSVAVLGAIVLIRTVLSFSIDIEIDGTLPWRRSPEPGVVSEGPR